VNWTSKYKRNLYVLPSAASCVWDIAEKNGYQFNHLDIGGGFSGHDYDNPSFQEVASDIHDLLDKQYPANVKIIGEPGRYFSSASTVLVTNVIARRVQTEEYKQSYTGLDQASGTGELSESEQEDMREVENAQYLYYINDGIYGAFNAIVFDHKVFIVHTLTQDEVKLIRNCKRSGESEKFSSVIFGPCCDSLDCIAHNIQLPKLDVGDWMWFPDMGSYTVASASSFNGFHTDKYHFIWKNQ
jgi:ornithine decarboxylase